MDRMDRIKRSNQKNRVLYSFASQAIDLTWVIVDCWGPPRYSARYACRCLHNPLLLFRILSILNNPPSRSRKPGVGLT
jgi:hypothetical protein